MPLYKKYILNSGAQVVVWEIQESPSYELEILETLSDENKCIYAEIQSNKRKREFLFTRYILEKVLGVDEVIVYTEAGAPTLRSSEISISHSGNFVSVGLSSAEIGIDIQLLNPKIERIAHKFVNEAEARFIEESIALKQQTIIWSAKEALYKLDAQGGLLFKEQLHIAPFNITAQFLAKGSILKNDTIRSCQLNVWHNNNYSLVIAEDEI
ncbi:MAG: 4'-phosphopantetheinyl transferase [Flavobacteriales bacterium]|jgi:4'-phosphopantetheinyl transferase